MPSTEPPDENPGGADARGAEARSPADRDENDAQPQPTSKHDAPVTLRWLILAIAGFLGLALIALWAAQHSPYG